MRERIFDTININKSRARKDTSSSSQRKRIRWLLAFGMETRVDFLMFYLIGFVLFAFLVLLKKKKKSASLREIIPFIRVHTRLRERSSDIFDIRKVELL